jgi:hypothetical protein
MDINVQNGKRTKAFYEVVANSTTDKLNVQVYDSNGNEINHKVTLFCHQCDADGAGDTGTNIATATAGAIDVIVSTKLYAITTDDTGTFSCAATATDIINVVAPDGRANIVTIV